MEEKHSGQKELQARVVRAGLCTGCGACVGLCPYQASYEDRLVFLNRCDLTSGRCHAFCPRTPTDLHALREALFDRTDLTPEIGAVRGFYLARARDLRIREKAQHGGSVTALIYLALKEGLIGEAVLTGAGEDLLPQEVRISDPEEVTELAKSRFVVSPVLGLFNRLAVDDPVKIGIVATPLPGPGAGKDASQDGRKKNGSRRSFETRHRPFLRLGSVMGESARTAPGEGGHMSHPRNGRSPQPVSFARCSYGNRGRSPFLSMR